MILKQVRQSSVRTEGGVWPEEMMMMLVDEGLTAATGDSLSLCWVNTILRLVGVEQEIDEAAALKSYLQEKISQSNLYRHNDLVCQNQLTT